MSQKIVLELLRELGRATTGEVGRLARERYPDSSLCQYVSDRLNKLRKWRTIGKDKEGFWYVIEHTEN